MSHRGVSSPCYQCNARYIGCHDECEKYLERKRKIYEAKKVEQEINNYICWQSGINAEITRKCNSR
jgi:hypothetical protein